MRAAMIAIVIVWSLIVAAYLLFAGTVSLDEVATAAAVASCGTAWAAVIRRCASRRFAVPPGLIMSVLRALADLPPATARTGMLLLRVALAGGSPGRSKPTPFQFGARKDPVQRSRRAIALVLASLAPDRFVVAADRNDRTVLIHDLLGRTQAADPRWLQ